MIKINSNFETKTSPHHPDRNEDAYLEDQENNVYAVFDGMGGLPDAQMAAKTAKEQLQSLSENIDKESTQSAREDLKEIIKEIQNQIEKKGENRAEKRGLGTTASILTLLQKQNKAVLIHCGDSRIYRFYEDELKQLTQDHDMIWKAKREGQLNEKKANEIRNKINQAEKEEELDQETKAYFEGRNILASSLGGRREAQIRTKIIELAQNSTFLLCTDGIHDNLKLGQIKKHLEDTDPDPKDLLKDAQDIFKSKTFRAKPDDLTAGIITVS